MAVFNWTDRIKQYNRKKAAHTKAKAKAEEVEQAFKDDKKDLLKQLTKRKEKAGEEPVTVVAGRMIGKEYGTSNGCANEDRLVQYLVEAKAYGLLKPRVGEVHTAIASGTISDEEIAKKIKRILTTAKFPKLFDRAAPKAKGSK